MAFRPSHDQFGMPERSLEECLRLWGTVMVRARNKTHQDFADKIAHQAARRDWAPGIQQLAFIRKLVDIYAHDDIALDPELIELLQLDGGEH